MPSQPIGTSFDMDSTAGQFTAGYSGHDVEQMDGPQIASFISNAGGIQNLHDSDVDKLFIGYGPEFQKQNRELSKQLYDEYTRRGLGKEVQQ